MLDLNNKEKPKEVTDSNFQKQESVEKKEFLQENKEKILKIDSDETIEMRRKIEKAQISDELEDKAVKSANDLSVLDEEGKIKKLLDLARSKDNGVVYAVKVAQKMNDPFFLDRLHDILEENGLSEDSLK